MAWWKGKNIGIFGGTRQGKTVLGNQIVAQDGRVGVWFAPDPEPWMVGVKVRSVEELIQGVKQGRRNFVVPVGLWGNVKGHHETWCRELLDLCNKVPGFEVTFAVDEAQDCDKSMLNLASKRGLKRGFRQLIMTQSPASRDVPLEALRQCDYYVWVGPIGTFDKEYVRDKGLFDPGPMLDNPDHQYVVVTRTGKPVAKGYADNRKYGPG